jgi:aminomuconate-semialdehyde/2-hydroxymuconate-6-semialdehyde dehydrogenase
METLHNAIAGSFQPAASGQTLDNFSSVTGERLATIPRSDAKDVDEAVTAARAALDGAWGQSTVAERADLLEAVADVIESRLEELAALESRDTGKPFRLAAAIDIPRAVANFRFFASAVRQHRDGFFEMPGALNYTLRRPVGVMGLITPWNLPLYLLSWKTAPALAMGNTIVAKPSEMTPMTATVLAEILHEVGAPPGVFNLVHGLGPEVGQAIVEHPGVDGISFTGGTATGAIVGATASRGFKKVSLELGGKNPTVVFADCTLESAIDGALRAAFANQGQVCLCGSRILVERSIFAPFVDGFVKRAAAMKVGDPADPDVDMGAVISLAHRDKIEGYLRLAKEEGGQILCGGTRPDLPAPLDLGAFITPAVITGLTQECRTTQEEIFGPVVCIYPFDSEAEAVSMANGVRFGLSASVWTENLSRAHRVAAALDVGMVWINTWLMRDLRTAFGGVKASGVGREGGDHSLDFFSEPKNVCVAVSAS